MGADARLRIAIVCPGAADLYRSSGPRQVGGAETLPHTLAGELARHADVHMVVDDPDESLVAPPGITLHPVPLRAARRSAVPPLAAARFRRLLRSSLDAVRPDLVYQHCAGYETVFAQAWARARGVPFVYHWGADTDLGGLMGRRPMGSRLFVRARQRADLQLCQTEAQLESLPEAERARATVLPNPLRGGFFPRRSRGGHVLWVGRIRPLKRPDLFLKLAAALPDRSFVMAGDVSGDPAAHKAFRDAAARLPNLRLAGHLAGAGLADAYSGAQVLVNTSDSEGFPNTFLEACAAGVPVVSLRCDPNGMLARQGAGSMLDGDEEALAGAVEALFEPGSWKRAQQAALQVAAAHQPGPIVDGVWPTLQALARRQGRVQGRATAG